MDSEERKRVVDVFARAMYACTFQRPLEDSRHVDEAWRIWRKEAERVLDEAFGPKRGE